AELVKVRRPFEACALELAQDATAVPLPPLRLAGVEDEPALALRNEPALRRHQLCLGNHARSMPSRRRVTSWRAAAKAALTRRLEGSQVLLLFPLGDLDAVLVPLATLQLDVAREDVLAERTLHQLGRCELVDRLAERA